MKKKILLTGGHAATTALSVVEEILRRNDRGADWDIYWVGSSVAVEGKNIRTLESQVFPKAGIKSFSIFSGKLPLKFNKWSLVSFFKTPFGFIHAIYLVLKIKPNIILSFGGSASFPMIFVGWLLGIPIVIHEQVATAGRANITASMFAKKIAIARSQSKRFFPNSKCVITGNPILTRIGEVKSKLILEPNPVIFVTGGSRGSQTINESIKPILPRLLEKYTVVHQSGYLDLEEFEKLRDNLSLPLKNRYEVSPIIDPGEMDKIYKKCDLIIGRAGANTVSEIIAVKRPALLIPIPWSYANEQYENAKLAEDFGIAKILDQETLTSDKLLKEIEEAFDNWPETVRKIKNKKSPDLAASKKLVDLLEENIK